jgi:hypothetical protein
MDMEHLVVHDRFDGEAGDIRMIINTGDSDAMIGNTCGIFTGRLVRCLRSSRSPAKKGTERCVEKTGIDCIKNLFEIVVAALCRPFL